MPKSKSVLKRQRQTERRRVRRKGARSELRTLERRVRSATDESAAKADFRALQKSIDHAAAKGDLHPNKAARKKSRLAKQLAKKSAG